MFKDIRTEVKNWYVIHGDEHLKIGSFSDAIAIMAARWDNDNSKQLIMMSDKEYANWDKRKTKRGKNS